MGTQSKTSSNVSPTTVGELTRRGVVALVLAIAATVAFVVVANVAGVAPEFEAYVPFIAARGAAIGVVGATIVYGIVARFSEHPRRLFTAIAAVVYLLSLIPVVVRAPGLPGATTLGVALLPVMHALVALPTVAVLTGRISVP
jgi:hypothetical protein